jgi:type VI secretion system protein ImpC
MTEALTHLLAALRAARVDVAAEDVADAIWLTLCRDKVAESAPLPDESVAPTPAETPPSARDETPAQRPEPPVSPAPAPSAPEAKAAVGGELYLPRSLPGGTGVGGQAIRSPTGAALPGALALARALRPLRQRVPSRTRMVFDDLETVRRVAEEGIWLPALRPARDRWLDVALVVDAGASMGVWRSAAVELRKLLEWMGAFRNVRVWRLDTEVGPPLLHAGFRRHPDSPSRNPLELVDPNGRSLILVLTDCVSDAWHDGSAARLLETWSRHGPLALLQVLPEHLWSRTALGTAAPVRLCAPSAAAPNARLRAEAVYDWPDPPPQAGTPLLISSLEPHGLAALARLVAGMGGGSAPGFVLDTESSPRSAAAPSPVLDADTRVANFWKAASPVARRLAGMLAAAPVLSLPVVRLVRQALLPGAWQVHEAEVLLGGLLRVVPGQDEEALDPDEILYDFHEGVRSKLLDAVPTTHTKQVLEKVSAYVEEHLTQAIDFRAILADPEAHQGTLIADDSPFAHIAAEVLERLGGAYARLVRSLPAVPVPSVGSGEGAAVEPGQRPELLRGHTGAVRSVGFSPDGRILASGSFDETVKLWDWATGRLLRTLRGHKGVAESSRDRTPGVNSVAFAPDGKTLASGGLDGTIKLWSVADGKELATLRGHAGRVLSVAFAPDGLTLASASDDLTAKLWDVATRSKRISLRGHAKTVECGAFTPDGKALATGSWDGTVKLWEVASGQLLATIRGRKSEVLAVAFAPDGKTLATASAGGTVRLWDVATRTERTVIGAHQHKARTLAFSPDGRVLASAAWTVRLWDAQTGQALITIRDATDKRWCLAFSQDGKTLVSGSQNQSIRLWDVDRLLAGRTGTVPVEEPKLTNPDGPKHWVLVVSPASMYSDMRIIEACMIVGATLAREGYGLISGGWGGGGRVVAECFDKELTNLGRQPLANWLVQVVPRGIPADQPGGEQVRFPGGKVIEVEVGPGNLAFQTSVKLADAVVLISGAGTALKIARAAEVAGKPIIPLAFTGGTALRMHEILVPHWPDLRTLEIPLNPDGQPLRRLLADVLRPEAANPEPPPRVHITYDVEVNGAVEKVELPFVVGVLADLVGYSREAPEPLKGRKFVSVDKHTFGEVLQKAAPRLALKAKNRLADDGSLLAVDLMFRNLDDFGPLGVIQQVEPLRLLFEERQEYVRRMQEQGDIKFFWEAGHGRGTVTLEEYKTHCQQQIEQLDQKLSVQLAEILHHPDFQRLEATWRGLYYLVQQTETSPSLKIRVLNVSKRDLFKDAEKAIEFDQTTLFRKVYEDELGPYGGEPYGLLLGDYEFSHNPEDIQLLKMIARVAAVAHAPFVAAASPSLFRFERFTELTAPRDLDKIFHSAEYAGWHAFRDLPESRYVALTLPRVLGRLPYGKHFQPIEASPFDEPIDGPNHDKFLWMSAAWAYAVRVTAAFTRYGWFAHIRGVDGGGKVEGLPVHTFPTDHGEVTSRCPVEIAVSDRRELELSKLGFLPLVYLRNPECAVFLVAQSCGKPKSHSDETTNASSQVLVKLNYTLCVSRFAHYLEMLARDKVGSFQEVRDCEDRLNRWLKNYVAADTGEVSEAVNARRPLADARVEVREVPEMPGRYQLVAWIRLAYQFDPETPPLRVVAEVSMKR